MRKAHGRPAVLALLLAAACRGGDATPSPIQLGTPCAFCRMSIADVHLAGEVAAPGEEPRQYDDIGCLADDLKKRPLARGARAFVADYQSGALVPAAHAAYTRLDTIETPMMSHVVAHADEAARDRDPRVRAGMRQTARDIFGAGGPGGSDGR
jgi:copper chaperone NosL